MEEEVPQALIAPGQTNAQELSVQPKLPFAKYFLWRTDCDGSSISLLEEEHRFVFHSSMGITDRSKMVQ